VHQGCQNFLATKYQIAINERNGHKIYQIAINAPNDHKTFQHIPFQGPPKYTKIGIYVMKLYKLSTSFYDTFPFTIASPKKYDIVLGIEPANFRAVSQKTEATVVDYLHVKVHPAASSDSHYCNFS
jgi:hypothetical protein